MVQERWEQGWHAKDDCQSFRPRESSGAATESVGRPAQLWHALAGRGLRPQWVHSSGPRGNEDRPQRHTTSSARPRIMPPASDGESQ